MRFGRIIIGAAFSFAIIASTGASAFEKTQMGGTNPDGSAHYQDPDEQQLPSPLGGTQFQQGSETSPSSQNQTFQWSMTPGSGSATEAKSGFNEPLLRERP